ncbi:DUF4856 domain-containing protein [Altibacter sp. HG106]|uniref:DUF4856 domain-containing protein n=1 Tax=Altibacter sp. HG106 TaxID=3023937 RepID=UPI00234FCC72|nr:DUF4856 domain-containing protein [Altibacter sp. HG106]MDC7996271.1 DUF4856 domain-containing protein [Altibacter sp. HG106]
MRIPFYYTVIFALFGLVSCATDDDAGTVNDPTTVATPEMYSFVRDGESTVSFSGQTTRIQMAEEMLSVFLDFDTTTEDLLLNMLSNENSPFSDPSLNESDKNILSKIAASEDYFSGNTAGSATVRNQFESYITSVISEVYPNTEQAAAPGVPGQISDGSSTRFVNGKGLEYNQAFGKSMIGALMLDQALNNYLSSAVLDAGNNRENNTAKITEAEASYTTMEHKWDEAYGYVYGNAAMPENPNTTIGEDDSFLNKYVGRVNSDDDYNTIAQEIFDAFALGRAAIVANDYELRDAQAEIIRNRLSLVIAVRSIYYLQQAKTAIIAENYGTAFHDLSEAYGFIYSLQFTRNTATNAPYFDAAEVDVLLNNVQQAEGFWEVTPEILDAMSATIADRFGITVAEAGS